MLFSTQRDILNFLREGELPHRNRVRAVHREAQYYSIGPLLDSLEDIQPLTGEKVRQAFLDLLPYYKGESSEGSVTASPVSLKKLWIQLFYIYSIIKPSKTQVHGIMIYVFILKLN